MEDGRRHLSYCSRLQTTILNVRRTPQLFTFKHNFKQNIARRNDKPAWQFDAGTPCSHLVPPIEWTDRQTDGRIAALLFMPCNNLYCREQTATGNFWPLADVSVNFKNTHVSIDQYERMNGLIATFRTAREGWANEHYTRFSFCCTKRNNQPIKCHCTNFMLFGIRYMAKQKT